MRKQLLLREDEKTTLMNDAAVSTISFYSGTTDAAWLRTRVRDMVRCNPVLGGNLVTGPEGPQVDYDDTSKVGTGFFTMVEGPVAAELVPTTAYDQLAAACQPYTAKRGAECLDKLADDPAGLLFRVTLFVTHSEHSSGTSALLVSMPHFLGDAYTFYRLYAMLHKHADCNTLSWERGTDFLSKKARLFDPDILACLQTPAAGAGFARNFAAPVQHALYDVDAAVIAARKSNSTVVRDVEFVSTNDVVTGWYFAQRTPEACVMVMNLRQRLADINDEIMGNYQGELIFANHDAHQPSQIRSALSFKPIKGARSVLNQERLEQGHVAVVTNWASFYVDVEIEGCEMLLHLPVYGSDCGVGSCLIIFQKSKEKLSVLERRRDSICLDTLNDSPLAPFSQIS